MNRYSLVGLLPITLLALVLSMPSCRPPVHYVMATDGQCLKLVGGGWWTTYTFPVTRSRCQ